MKKLNKLFAILIAVMSVSILSAQTDVTNQYLTSANFSSTSGWTQYISDSYRDIGSGNIGGALGDYAASTTDGSHLSSEYFFAFQCRWNGNYASYNQETAELPAGVYTLSYDVENMNGSTTAANYNNLFYVRVGDKTYTDSYTEWMAGSTGWTSHSITFVITESTKATVSLGYGTGSNNFVSANTPVLYVSHLKLEYTSFDDALESGWTAPQVPGTDIASLVGTGVNVGMYNVKADAFTTRAMNWSTQAAATKLHNSDSQTEGTSNRHHVNVVKGSGSTIKFNFPCIGNTGKWLGDGGQGSTKAVFTDNDSKNYEFNYSVVNEKTHVYTLKVATATSEDNAYLDVWQPYGGQLTYAEGQGFTEWAFIRFSDIENGNYATYKAKKALYEIYQAVVAAGHENTFQEELRTAFMTYIRTDVTAADVTAATNVLLNAVSPALTTGYVNANALFTNPDIRGAGTKADWTAGYTNISWGCFENYHTNHGERELTQTKNVPNGFYKVVFHGIWRQDGSDVAPTLTLSSNGKSTSANVPCITDIDFGVTNTSNNNWADNNGKIVPNGMQSAGEGLSHGAAQVTISDFVVSDGQLTIEMNSSSTTQWILAQGFDIYFKAESLEEYANLFYDAKSVAQAIDQNTLNTYAKDLLSTALSNAETEQINKEWYQEQTAALKSAVAIANEIKVPYAKLAPLIALCTEYTENSNANSDDVLSTFNTAISTAITAANEATTADALNTVYNTLESARQAYAQNAVPVYPYPFDMTFLLPNTTFDNNTDGWTKSGGANWMAAGRNVECYNNTFEFSMEYTGLNSGSWEIQVDAFYRYGGYNDAETAHNNGTEQLHAILYANNNTVAVKSIMEGANKAGSGTTTAGGVRIPNGPADCDAYFATGCYTNAIATVIADGKLKVGIKKETTQGSDWTIFDNFKLIYKGIDVTDLQNALSELIKKADAIKDEKMGAAESATLSTALDNADVTVTNADDLSEMISNLQSAYDAAEVSVDTYSKVPAYIAKAKAIGVALADTYQTQYDNNTIEGNAETVFQALEVATYSYVKDTFPYDVELLKADGWNSEGTNTKDADFSNEHWSGETRNYKNQDDTNGQGWNASAWSIDFDQSVTLPAGEYVFKVAGRKSAEATLELTVTMGETVLGSVNDFPSSNNTKGINKAGATSFDADDPEGFANDGNGFGWQWRYVKFTLATESTVKVAVHAEANAIHQWVSFGDYTLHMDESAYLEANKDALVAPMAAAQALVGVKPMGKDEATALQAAIDMPVTKGAELKAKIEALNAAVASAEAWIPLYDEAKAPLVAALERFEADYNDAQNGALDYMNKSRWATAISMAQAAAEAKDVTDSYDGFETATNDLVAALDAATVSVGEYADLKAAIETAAPLYNGGNWGDKPFQRPTSAKDSLNTTTAQATYDAATADGEAVTSLTETLNNGINGIVLNAPAENTAYRLVLSNNGNWTHDGNAVTYLANTRADHGLYNIQYYAAPNANYAQAFTFTAVEGKNNCYTLSMTDIDGNQRYICTGVSYGGNPAQLRTTTDAEDALVVKVIATATDGIHQLYNTEANNYIGSQDNGFFTVNSHTNFSIQEAQKANITLTLSNVGWATLILPFDAELPEGVKAWSCAEADGEELTLTEATSIKANTPYLMNGNPGEYSFSGYGLADKDSYDEGLFVGTYVEYKTTVNSNTYVLQKIDGDAAFYLVGESGQPTVGAYRCYMVYEGAAGAPKFSFGRGQGTTSIDNMESTLNTQPSTIIYDLMGRKVSAMEKGGIYIVNGKKVIVK